MKRKNNLWGGRFKQESNETFAKFNSSFSFDRRLFSADIRSSIAHCNGLFRAGILTQLESERIKEGLKTLLERNDCENNQFDCEVEDVHSYIETELTKIIGETALKLHTGRSRNDQVVTAFRLWLREQISEISKLVENLQNALVDLGEENIDAVLPGYTHLQRAQPVLWAHWCLAYFEMFRRDRERLEEVCKRVNVLPLGSGALAGTSYEIDREAVARELGFSRITANSLDAVSDRDFAIEFVGSCAILMMHLSRLAEDLIIYATQEFGFIDLNDAISTGSSLMPQKKNPDSLELIRGKSSRVFGHHTALLAMMKGLPLAYNKDMQEDKEAVFDTFDTVSETLRVAELVLRNIKINVEKSKFAATKGFLNATELADYLVRKGVPFRQAHEIAGKIVLQAIKFDVELNDLEIAEMQKFSKVIEFDIYNHLSLKQTLQTKHTVGGTSPNSVKEALSIAKSYLEQN